VRKHTFRCALAAALAASSAFAQKLQVNLLSEAEVQARLESGRVAQSKRQDVLRELFEKSGCAPAEQRVVGPRLGRRGNLLCTLAGETGSTIVVGGHMDFVPRGDGIVDDWSGASLLPSLYSALKSQQRRHTFVFAGFTAEEMGLVGSSHYVRSLKREGRSSIAAFVNLECLGLGPMKVWVRRSTPELVARLREMAATMEMGLEGMNVDRVGDDDTHPFFNAHIPVISIHSLTQETLPILHSLRDRVSAVHPADYYNAYRLVAFYLAYLDLKLAAGAGDSR
jgi:hypothetical protein